MRENDKTPGTELHSEATRSRHRLTDANEPIVGLALLLTTGLGLLVAVAILLRG
jgi:hypothetical protein